MEKKVLSFGIQGFTNKMIAKHLHLSPRTVDDYFQKIYFKAGDDIFGNKRTRLAYLWMNSQITLT
jgi:DNA-binding NarL/FixJ family response regulator